MARYIDATKLLWIYEHECEKYSGLDEMVADVPTEDVVEVVRCEKCKWQRKQLLNNGYSWCKCGYGNESLGHDGEFCSDGERRENEQREDN